MVELRGLEPLTSSTLSRRSPTLSYSPDRRGMVAERPPARQGRWRFTYVERPGPLACGPGRDQAGLMIAYANSWKNFG